MRRKQVGISILVLVIMTFVGFIWLINQKPTAIKVQMPTEEQLQIKRDQKKEMMQSLITDKNKITWGRSNIRKSSDNRTISQSK